MKPKKTDKKAVSDKTIEELRTVGRAYLKAHPKKTTLFGGLVPLYVNQKSASELENINNFEMKAASESGKGDFYRVMYDLYGIYQALPSQKGAIAIVICEAFRREYGELYQTMLSLKNPCELVQGMADEAAINQMAMEALLGLTP